MPTIDTAEKMITVPDFELGLLLNACINDLPEEAKDEQVSAAFHRLMHLWHDRNEQVCAEMVTPDPAPLPPSPLPPPVADFGPVRLELMGHRYREGHLSEVVIAGTPFLRLDLEGGAVELYRPDAVYCITPGLLPPPVPRAEIPARYMDHDPDEDLTDDDDDEGY